MLRVSQTCACGRLAQWNMKLFGEHTQRHSLNYLGSIAPRCAVQQLRNAWDCCWNKAECGGYGGCGWEREAGDDLREWKAPYVETGVSKLFSLGKLNRARLYILIVGLLNAHASRNVTVGRLVNSNRRFEGILCKENQRGAQIVLICLLLFSTCFGQQCAHHQEKIPYLCDTWHLSLYIDDCFTPNSHPYGVTNARCRIGTVFSPDDGHIVARNM